MDHVRCVAWGTDGQRAAEALRHLSSISTTFAGRVTGTITIGDFRMVR
jgi:hypothetical protein